MKDVLLVIALLVTVALGVILIRFSEKVTKAGKNLEEERYSRMVAEETLQRNSAKLAALQSQLKSKEDKMAKIEDILTQEKNVNTDLKAQYEKLNQSKSELESKLQAAMQEKDQVVQAMNPNPAGSPAPTVGQAQ